MPMGFTYAFVWLLHTQEVVVKSASSKNNWVEDILPEL